MNLKLKKRIIIGLFVLANIGCDYGFMMKPEESGSNILKLILIICGVASLIVAIVMQDQINDSNPPSSD